MTKKAEESNKEPEAAPSGDVTENEEEAAEVKPPKVEKKPAPVIEQVEINNTVPAWFKPFAQKLDAIAEGLKPTPPTEPKSEQPAQPPAEEKKGEAQNAKKKKGKINFWRTF